MGALTYPPTTTPQPTLAGFQNFVWNEQGIPQAALPIDSVWWGWAFGFATGTVNRKLNQVPGPFYLLAVYNLGMDFLVNNAADQPAPAGLYPENNPDGKLYFAYLRDKMDLNGFKAGVIEASADETTSANFAVPDALKNLTVDQLQLTKTPWGRNYLGYAQKVGTLVGIT